MEFTGTVAAHREGYRGRARGALLPARPLTACVIFQKVMEWPFLNLKEHFLIKQLSSLWKCYFLPIRVPLFLKSFKNDYGKSGGGWGADLGVLVETEFPNEFYMWNIRALHREWLPSESCPLPLTGLPVDSLGIYLCSQQPRGAWLKARVFLAKRKQCEVHRSPGPSPSAKCLGLITPVEKIRLL